MSKKARLLALAAAALLAVRSAPFVKAEERIPAAIGPEKGTLLIVGGGDKATLWPRFLTLAGGLNAPIVIITTAHQITGEDNRDVVELRASGATDVTVLHTRNPHVANEPSFVEPIKRARAVWVTGGRQWRLVDAYLNTLVQKELQALLARGGVIGGSSAGASIQASYLVRGAREGNKILMAPGYEQGFGFLQHVAIDQHVNTREREEDLETVVAAHPENLGIGIDEATAIIVRRDECEVIGSHTVRFGQIVDGQYRSQVLRAGQRYDLRQRQLRALDGSDR